MRRELLLLIGLAVPACTVQREQPNLVGQDVRLKIIHTSDIHSRILPYHFVPGRIDETYGLLPNEGPYGGIARMGYMIKEERAKVARSLWLDSGDWFQGAPIFNVFRGEAEFRVLGELGVEGAVLGNHEWDLGSNNLYEQATDWSTFPLLVANYYFEDPREPTMPKLAEIVQPYQLYDVHGVIVGVVGMGSQQSMLSLYEGGNSLGLRPLDDAESLASWVRILRPVSDLVVVLSHMGLDQDEGMAPSEIDDPTAELTVEGVDLILGGHLHIVLNPPKILGYDSYGHPTVLVHSGAFAKFVGVLDLVVRIGEDNADPARRSHITAFTYENQPVSCGYRTDPTEPCPNPVDPDVAQLLVPYEMQLNQMIDLQGVFAYVNTSAETKIVRNDASGGDSQLGNMVARAMQMRQGVDADFAITNSLGIRADFEQGKLTNEAMFNVFPFENSITIMYLSGVEVRETLNFVARKSTERGCRTQAQVAGITFKMVCSKTDGGRAEEIYIGDDCRKDDGTIDTTRCMPLSDTALYRVAVNDYIAAGGSGFTVLKRNTSKQNTGIALRSALVDWLRKMPACPDDLVDLEGGLVSENYGPVACIDETIEEHDGRILPVYE